MPKKPTKRQTANLATGLIILALVLELSNVLIAFTLVHPDRDACSTQQTMFPAFCFFLSLFSFVFAIAALAISLTKPIKRLIIPISIFLIVFTIGLVPAIAHQTGFVLINLCNLRW